MGSFPASQGGCRGMRIPDSTASVPPFATSVNASSSTVQVFFEGGQGRCLARDLYVTPRLSIVHLGGDRLTTGDERTSIDGAFEPSVPNATRGRAVSQSRGTGNADGA